MFAAHANLLNQTIILKLQSNNRLIMEKCQTVSQSNASNLIDNANMHIPDSARKREKEGRRVHTLFGDIDLLRSFQRFALLLDSANQQSILKGRTLNVGLKSFSVVKKRAFIERIIHLMKELAR